MRVQGNVSPEVVTVEHYLPSPGMAEVRLRENVTEITLKDAETEITATRYEYDEYTTLLPDRPGLKDEINANLTGWLATLRSMEVSENASVLRAAREENAALLDGMAELVEDVYQSDMEMMGS